MKVLRVKVGFEGHPSLFEWDSTRDAVDMVVKVDGANITVGPPNGQVIKQYGNIPFEVDWEKDG